MKSSSGSTRSANLERVTPPITSRTIRRQPHPTPQTLTADICVLGAGIAGVSAALEAAKLGRHVIIVDAAPSLGGQAVGSIIGTIIGLYTHGPQPYQITHGVADELIADLTEEGSLSRRESMTGTITFQYDEVRLARWMERKVEEAGVRALVGAVLTDVGFDNRRVRHLELATRFASGQRPTSMPPAMPRCVIRPGSRFASPMRPSTAH